MLSGINVCGHCNVEVHDSLVSSCEICNGDFCFVHRLPKDHDCVRPISLGQRLLGSVRSPKVGKDRGGIRQKEPTKDLDGAHVNISNTGPESVMGVIGLPGHLKSRISDLVEEGRYASEMEFLTKVLEEWFEREKAGGPSIHDRGDPVGYTLGRIDGIMNHKATPPEVFDTVSEVRRQLKDDDIQIYNKVTYAIFNFEAMSRSRKVPNNIRGIIDEVLRYLEEYSEDMYS